MKRLIEERPYITLFIGVLAISFADILIRLADAPYFMAKLGNEGLAVLFLENDYTWGDTGQLRTRVEAFIEMLDNRRR